MFTRKQTLIGGALALVAVAVAAFVVVWLMVLSDDAPSQASLAGAVASLDGPGDAAPTAVAGAQNSGLIGRWTLAANGESFVGYRVREELARIGTTTAVGRTRSVTGSLRFDGSAITEVRIEADLRNLQSDDSRRDGALRRQALETDRYPTASFVLTEPIRLGAVPAESQPLAATAVGDLTIHGATRNVSIDLEGQLANGFVVVVGSLDIRFADYGIAQPSSLAVLSVEDRGTMELQLIFEKSAQG
jgi:polyisoprenoid-binding protein YceI